MVKFNKREALKGQIQTRGVTAKVNQVQDDTNTLSFVLVSDDNGGERFDWASGEYYTELLDVNGAVVDRLNTFFKDHSHSVDSAIGKVFNVRVEDGQLVGDVTFGTDDDSQTIYRKYSEGILTDVSIYYEIEDYTVTRGADSESDEVLITRYSLFELSAVGIGFDSGAKKRNEDVKTEGSPKMDEKQLERLAQLEAMSKRNKEQNEELRGLIDAQKVALDAEREALKVEKVELARQKAILSTVADFGERGQKVLDSFGDKKPTDEQLRAKILSDFAGETVDVQPKSDNNEDKRSKMIDAMVDGLALRVGAKIDKPVDGAEAYRHMSLVDIAKNLLPESERNLAPVDVAKRSLVTGDFPLLLQSVGSRVLTSEFEAQTATYKAWMKMVDVPDFRTMTELTTSFGGGRLKKIKERADLEKIGGTEQAESWKIETFGNSFELSREMLINDDLGNFTNLVSTFGRMAQTTANGIAYDILQEKGDYASYLMADGVSLYDGARNNSATDALSSTALSAGRLAMASHLSVDGETPLNIKPKYLIVSPALEVTAREILGATQKLGADNVSVPNVNQNLYELIVDPEIESETAWYLLAENRTFKMGFLAGTNRSPVIEQTHSSVSGSEFEGVFDIGVMAEDYRGLYQGNV